MNVEAAHELIRGAVDLYAHAIPDLLPRRLTDVALAAEMKRDGFRAAVHRHQFAATGERAALASEVTGFDMRGAIALNGTVGGLNAIVVEHAIRMGAVVVSMPTLSGSRYQARISEYARAAATLAGPVPVVDPNGKVLPAVHDVMASVHDQDVVLNLGYLDYAESMAVLQVARDRGVRKILATNPMAVMALSEGQIGELMAVPEVTLEFASTTLRPREGKPAAARAAIAGTIRRYGVDRCVVSSDVSGGNDLTALELLTLSCMALSEEGITPDQLRKLVYDTPARLIGIA